MHALPTPTRQAATSMSAGEVLLRRARPSAHVYHVQRGKIVMGLLDSDGGLRELGWLEGPCWLDPASAVLGLEPLMDIVAETDVQARAVPMAEFSANLNALSEPMATLMRDLARVHRDQAKLTVRRWGMDAEARCAQWVLDHAKPDAEGGATLTLKSRKRDVARHLGITPETFSRMLRRFRERQWIGGTGRSIEVLNAKALQTAANGTA